MLKIEILTIFPEILQGFFSSSLIAKAIDRELLSFRAVNIRDFADAPHYKVDDVPYGGGAGMIMKPEPIYRALADSKARLPSAKVILLSAGGTLFKQAIAQELSELNEIIFICGRYEGIDQRVRDHLVDYELSIGDYILMGGEVPAMAIIEAVARLKPELIGNANSLAEESFSQATIDVTDNDSTNLLLESPQYTRPAEFNSWKVPEILLSGNAAKIVQWRKEQAQERTINNRPDLLEKKND